MTVGFYAIVRDEAATAARMLDSAAQLCEVFTIVDTGSVDGTQEIVRDWFAASGRRGLLLERPWVDFGHNLNEAMRLAHGTADYLIFFGADDVLELHGELPALTHDLYYVRHLGYEETPRMPLLHRDMAELSYRGAVHSYLHYEGDSRDRLDAITVRAMPSDRTGKLERDLELLQRDLIADPANGRTIFYLAQTLANMGRRPEAIRLYDLRAGMGGWEEEAWYARYMAGAVSGNTHWLLEAYNRRPWRAEPLRELARAYRDAGLHYAAALFDQQADQLPLPAEDLIHVHEHHYGPRAAVELVFEPS